MSRINRELDWKEIENRYDIIEYISRYTLLKRQGNYYIGSCPFHNEQNPSFSVKNKTFQCYACQVKGSGIIDFIMKKDNVNFLDALNILKKDKILDSTKKITIHKPKIIKPLEIDFVDCNFTDQHKAYFEKLEMDQSFLEKKNVFAVKSWGMGYGQNKKIIPFTKDEYIFAYYASDIDKCKILRLGPEIDHKDKWRTNVPNTYLWYYNDYNNLYPKEIGFVVKSVKDALIVQKTGRPAIATNNESDVILLHNNIENIEKIFQKPIMCYGTDPDGKKKSINITKKTNWGWFNIPNSLYDLYNIEDFADYLNNGFNYKQLESMFKRKKL
jgi:hypothetical protein